MNYTVVIVEDEQLTRDELALTTPWSDLHLSLAGTAADGLEGERLIKELAPDIVITDIRLPGQDGLAMLKNCGVTHAVIISGYSDFSYMQQALRLEAFDYLLKPAGEGELEKTLASLVQKLDAAAETPANLPAGGDAFGVELPPVTDNFMVASALRVMEKRYGEVFGLQEAADELGISEGHLSRLFKEATGWNFQQYLNAYRINKSLELLRDPKNSILDIALACGFSAANYYTKLYRRFMGETPSRTREKMGRGDKA